MSWSPYDEPRKASPLPPINDCPFCRQGQCDTDLFGDGRMYYVSCGNCEADGPIGSTQRQAIELWNEATEEKE